MRCPQCHETEDKVIESRSLAHGKTTRRRRVCQKCGYRFTSYERIEEKAVMVIKQSGRREPFDKSKIANGVQKAMRKRPVSQAKISAMIDDLEEAVLRETMETHEITSVQLGEMVLQQIRAIDTVAYIRFASVYRNFNTAQEFIKVIQQLEILPQDSSGEGT